ncbi:MAG: hypothetical protein V2I63_00700 [Pseudomonadales bacterium]|jgi:hypothetical protein|nr:hypothetical protein [Pseudomonadales bacterium]
MSGDFEVLFRGEIYASVDPVQARTDMARLFRQQPERVMRLFDGRVWVLKDGLDRETAERYQVELAKIGLISEVRDRAPQIREEAGSPHGKSQNFTLESVAIVRMRCPDCGYEQLEADHCARCGVNVAHAKGKVRRKQKEDDIIQRRIQALRAPAEARAAGAPKVGAQQAPAAQASAAPPRAPLDAVAFAPPPRELDDQASHRGWILAGALTVAAIAGGLVFVA